MIDLLLQGLAVAGLCAGPIAIIVEAILLYNEMI